MLTLFAFPMWLGLLAPFIIRIALGLAFGYGALHKIRTRIKSLAFLGIIELILAVLVLLGLATQITSLFITLILVAYLLKKIKERAFLSSGVNYYVLLLAMALSLVFSGAGFYAFDLPL